MAIEFFGGKGKNAFLSNFYQWPVKAEINGKHYTFANGEAMFHALKALEFNDQKSFERLLSPQITPLQSKRIGRKVRNYNDRVWAKVRIEAMTQVERAKFSDPVLKNQLTKLSGQNLIENNPHDSFWGTGKNGKGSNNLGKILTKLSEELSDMFYRDDITLDGLNAILKKHPERNRMAYERLHQDHARRKREFYARVNERIKSHTHQ